MMRVQDVMSKGVRSVAPSQAADVAYETMRERGIHHLAVMRSGALVGVVSARDVSAAAVRKNHSVEDLMTTGVVTVPPDTPVRKAANLMRGRSIGCVVVTKARKVVGIVTVSDLLVALGKGEERPVVVGKRYTMRHTAPHRKFTGSTGAW